MAKRALTICELIGDTPIVRLNRLPAHGSAEVWGKLEWFNPAGCIKERIALSMIEAAEKDGRLQPGGTIVEPTSGNTGIGLAMIAAVKGYRCILTMPDSMSMERRKILQAFGAEIVLTDRVAGMPGAIAKAMELTAEIEGAYIPQQFINPANVQSHYDTTGPEIWQQTGGKIDAFVCGVGTGGTLVGAGKFLHAMNPHLHIIAVEPAQSPVLSGGKPGLHKIQGIGAGFIPDILDMRLVDRVIQVSNDEALETTRRLVREEGLFAGISSGAACHAAVQVAQELGKGKSVLTILPDTGERYLSTELFAFHEEEPAADTE